MASSVVEQVRENASEKAVERIFVTGRDRVLRESPTWARVRMDSRRRVVELRERDDGRVGVAVRAKKKQPWGCSSAWRIAKDPDRC